MSEETEWQELLVEDPDLVNPQDTVQMAALIYDLRKRVERLEAGEAQRQARRQANVSFVSAKGDLDRFARRVREAVANNPMAENAARLWGRKS